MCHHGKPVVSNSIPRILKGKYMDDRVQLLIARHRSDQTAAERARRRNSNHRRHSAGASGLIDSLSLVSLLQKLEDVTHTRPYLSPRSTQRLNTVTLMLATAGKPRNMAMAISGFLSMVSHRCLNAKSLGNSSNQRPNDGGQKNAELSFQQLFFCRQK